MEIVKTVQYKCSICDCLYNTKEDCARCENAHIRPKEISKATFRGDVFPGDYPLFIDVLMENKETVRYLYDRLLHE